MNKIIQNEFADIIKELETFRQISPGEDFKFRLRLLLNSNLPPAKISLVQRFIRYLAAIFALLTLLSSGLAFAAGTSKPGEVLYPIKKAMDQVKKLIKPVNQEITPEVNNDNLKENEPETSQQLIPQNISDSVVPSPTAVISKPVNSQIRIKLETPVQLPIPSITPIPDTLPTIESKIIILSPTKVSLNTSNTEILSVQISLPVKLNIGL